MKGHSFRNLACFTSIFLLLFYSFLLQSTTMRFSFYNVVLKLTYRFKTVVPTWSVIPAWWLIFQTHTQVSFKKSGGSTEISKLLILKIKLQEDFLTHYQTFSQNSMLELIQLMQLTLKEETSQTSMTYHPHPP